MNIEFFHRDCGPMGGYGMTAKNITDWFNTAEKSPFIFDLLLARPISKPSIKRFHHADVIVSPERDIGKIKDVLTYVRLLHQRNFRFLMTLEYFPSYEYPILFLPTTPLLVWIHDPRPEECIDEIATVSLELQSSGVKTIAQLKDTIPKRRVSIHNVMRLSKVTGRKVFFATTALSLIDKARKLYNMPDLNPYFLPTPVTIPSIDELTYSERPSVCFLGRLDPVKRPWIFFELAKRIPEVDFLVAGTTHFPFMNQIIDKYRSIKNLKFLGLVLGDEKDLLLRNIWVIVNTSVHEALPVSFIEALSYGKGIISCQNPDNLVGRFGVYTGQFLGDGYDEATLDAFEKAIRFYLKKDTATMRQLGLSARALMKESYSYEAFGATLSKIKGLVR